jgi:hypothetical protein
VKVDWTTYRDLDDPDAATRASKPCLSKKSHKGVQLTPPADIVII